jgi:hypothetical protein
MNKLVPVITVVFAAGCTVLPTVQYHVVKSPDDMKGMADSFFLQRSTIAIDLVSDTSAKNKDNKDVLVSDVSIVSKPAEYRDLKLAIKPSNNWRSNTTVTVNKVDNKELVASIGVEVTDTTVKTINAVGGAIVKVISLAGGLGLLEVHEACTLPITYDVPNNLPAEGSVDTGTTCFRLSVGKLPPDAMLATQIPVDSDTNYYYYAACRDAIVTLTLPNQTGNKTKTVRIADPRYVQLVQYPPKGTITSHSECGVSIKTEATSPTSAADIVDALATQGKAIKDAIDAAKKPAK